ncbi:cell envelope integrity protein CreD [Aliikangiella sp. IMCC44359]|uniref:cell envelope integrity protein CreD n=1 Tax=Aliikangiella sp. IMCC44359 TaxID=3459125 RepID=UPI00403AFBDE
MFEIFAVLIALALLLLIGLGALVLVKKLFGHSFGILNASQSLENDQASQASSPSYLSMGKKLPSLLKGIGIGVLGLVSLSILGLLEGITDERGQLYTNVTNEVGDTWGNSQIISGPALVIPFSYEVVDTKTYKSDNGEEKIRQVHRTVHDKMIILPEQLNVDINLDYDFRYRGIYQAMVYNAQLKGQAHFSKIAFKDKSITHIHYKDSYLSFGVSDNKAIQKVTQFALNNKPLKLNSGTNLNNVGISSGFHAPITLNQSSDNLSISFSVDFRGSKSISVLPLAEDTLLTVSSNWQHPSFHGMLPTSRKVTEKGFTAKWELSHLARNYPQRFRTSNELSLYEVSAKTMLFEPITHYSKVKRSVKYGILFICLTFLALFVFDLKKQVNFSLIQYCLVGASLSLFYLLLLSLSEHIGFLGAYLIAALTAILSITSYVGIAAKSRKSALLMAGLLSSLYSVLYSILQLEQFALLTGTLFLILIMLTLMYTTRHLAKPDNSYSTNK